MSQEPLATWEGRDTEFWRQTWQAGAVLFYRSVASTNDVVARLAVAGAPHFSIVVADEQLRGRGRGGSRWQAPAGTALLFSVLFRMKRQGSAPGCAPVRAGLAVAQAVEQLSGHKPLVKWPNDVVFSGHGKLAGILCEGAVGQSGRAHIVAGIGVNVTQDAQQFASELRGQACSIRSATGVFVERSQLLTDIVARLHAVAADITAPLSAQELQQLRMHDVLLDQAVVCGLEGGVTLAGRARGIARDGALLVEGQGGLRALYNGTVRLAGNVPYPGVGE